MGFDFQNTSYSGASATETQAAELSRQPASEFLTAVPQPDGSVVLQPRLPEMGHNESGDFRIRANFNYLTRALAAACLDEKGNPDPALAAPVMGNLVTLSMSLMTTAEKDGAAEKLADFCRVPDEHRDDFLRFVKDEEITNMLNKYALSSASYLGTVEKISGFQHMMNDAAAEEADPAVRKARDEIIRDSYDDYRNNLERFRELAKINPETETRVLAPMDCGDYGMINEQVMKCNNKWRDSLGYPLVKGEKLPLDFGKGGEDPEHGVYQAFSWHVVFAIEYQTGTDEPQVISVETTAPPTGKMIFNPNGGNTGVGIYPSKDAIYAYHAGRNTVVDPLTEMKLKMMGESYTRKDKVTSFNKHPDFEPMRQASGMTTEERMIWKDTLTALRDQLNATDSRFSKDSRDYKNLKKGLDDLLRGDWRALDGKQPEALGQFLGHLDELAGTYLEHCDSDQKIGSRRSTRMDVAETIRELVNMSKQGVRTPLEGCRETMLEKFLEYAKEYQLSRNSSQDYKDQINAMFDNPSRRREAKAQVENSQAFKALIGKGDVQTFHKLMKNPRKSYETFLANCKKYGSPEDTPPRPRARAAERHEQERSLGGN
ncbi:MAG: hypothetical protein MJ192_08505 [Clostridia bacterium]|nr:hypothetical protein [Clostridia bacterium]